MFQFKDLSRFTTSRGILVNSICELRITLKYRNGNKEYPSTCLFKWSMLLIYPIFCCFFSDEEVSWFIRVTVFFRQGGFLIYPSYCFFRRGGLLIYPSYCFFSDEEVSWFIQVTGSFRRFAFLLIIQVSVLFRQCGFWIIYLIFWFIQIIWLKISRSPWAISPCPSCLNSHNVIFGFLRVPGLYLRAHPRHDLHNYPSAGLLQHRHGARVGNVL